MLPGAPMPLEPLEYPPPNPPPLALANDTVGIPISEITIIAAMSLVVFKIRFLSIDVAGQSNTHRHPSRSGPKKTEYSRTSWLYVVMCHRFSLPLSGGVAQVALYCAHPWTATREARDMRERRDAKFEVWGSAFRKPRTLVRLARYPSFGRAASVILN